MLNSEVFIDLWDLFFSFFFFLGGGGGVSCCPAPKNCYSSIPVLGARLGYTRSYKLHQTNYFDNPGGGGGGGESRPNKFSRIIPKLPHEYCPNTCIAWIRYTGEIWGAQYPHLPPPPPPPKKKKKKNVSPVSYAYGSVCKKWNLASSPGTHIVMAVFM